ATAPLSGAALFCSRPTTGFRTRLTRAGWRLSLRRRLFVKLGADVLKLALEIVVSALDRVGVVFVDRFTDGGDRVLDRFAFVGRDFVAKFFQLFLGLIRQRVGVVLDLDRFLRLLVFVGVRFRFAAHLLNFILTQTARTGDGDFLLLAGAEIFGRHMQDAVGVDVEGHFDLRYAARGWRNSIEMERAEIFIVARKRPLAL